MLSRAIVDSTKYASHTYHVIIDSTIAFSLSLLIVPKLHRILSYRVMVDSTIALSVSLLIVAIPESF